MGEELTVSVYLDPDFDPIVKSLPSGSTVADLKESLAQDDPTGQMRVEHFDLAPKAEGARPLPASRGITQDLLELVICAPCTELQESPPAEVAAWGEGQPWEAQAWEQGQHWEGQPWEQAGAAAPDWHGQPWEGQPWGQGDEAAAAADPAAGRPSPGEQAAALQEAAAAQEEEEAVVCVCREYRVVQGPLVKKPGAQGPTGSKIIRVNRKVGSSIMTTGQTWTGPAGGEWVELDPSVEKPGWLLVEGPGFDLPGPLLERVDPGEEPSVVISLFSAINKTELCEVLVKQTSKIDTLKSWVSLKRRQDVPLHKIWLTKATPEDVDGKVFLKTMNMIDSGTVLKSLNFKDHETMVFVVIGKDGDMC